MTRSRPRIVLVGGCFDILHYGHIYFLRKAKTYGDYLVVFIESDKNIRKLKGNGRPIHNQDQRKEILESLKFVDKVIILKDKITDSDYLEFVSNIKPSVIATTKGDPMLGKKSAQAKVVGAKVVMIPKIKYLSTSKILRYLNVSETF